MGTVGRKSLDTLLIVLLCEIGERILATRGLLELPSVLTKPRARPVALLISRGLDAVEESLQRDVVEPLLAGTVNGQEGESLHFIARAAAHLEGLQARLDLLDARWNVAAVDIFLRKVCDDVGDLPLPSVVLTNGQHSLEDDVIETLRAEISALPCATTIDDAGALVALSRVDATDPLYWSLLYIPLTYLLVRRGEEASPAARAAVAVTLGGPAVYAALALHGLLFSSPDAAIAPLYAAGFQAATGCAGGLAGGGVEPFETADLLLLCRECIAQRDRALGVVPAVGGEPEPLWPSLSKAGTERRMEPRTEPRTASAREVDALLGKLASHTPINAIEPSVSPDFLQHLEGAETSADFYALIGPVEEQPSSLATILGVGWLYKVRSCYPRFRHLLQAHGRLSLALEAYAPLLSERNDLLTQSIEAAHVHDIFAGAGA